MKPLLVSLAWSALFLIGWAAVVHGVAMVSLPAAWIVGGLILAAIAFLLGIDHARHPHPEDEF